MNENDFFDYCKGHNKDHSNIELRLRAVEKGLGKVESAHKKMYKKMDSFMSTQKKDFTSFSRWLITTILITWFLGTCTHIGMVVNLKDKINNLDIKIISAESKHDDTQKKDKQDNISQ